jgi:hypothetical protein
MTYPVIISVRQPNTNSGGPVVPVREEAGHLDGNSHILILVHGYNNSRTESLGSYSEFLNHLRNTFSTLTAQVAEFLWPGDEPNKIISTLSYPNQIQPAKESAVELDRYFRGFGNTRPAVLHFVGHSLGCRVIVELLTAWGTAGLPPNMSVGIVVLMAAAVVAKNVDVGGALRNGATLSPKNPVLYSKGDPVLQWAFPIGETVAGEAFFPTAVGRTGGPPNTWHVPSPMAHNGNAYVHGDYWPGDESCAAVASALGGAPDLITPQNAIASSPAPAANGIEFRSTPVRSLAVRPAFA